MQWVQKAVQYYKDINPATLTGAIDVIVVEKELDDGESELACSPFHVRFGKLSVLRPIDKKVRIEVNDERVPFYMKVGETGEAFFVFETDENVPEDLQTSPLSGPASDAGDKEPEPLDIGESLTTPKVKDSKKMERGKSYESATPTGSRYASANQTVVSSPNAEDSPEPFGQNDKTATPEGPTNEVGDTAEQELSDSEEAGAHEAGRAKAASYVPGAVVLGAEKVSELGRAALTSLSAGTGNNVKLKKAVKREKSRHGASGEDDDGNDMGHEPNDELGKLEKDMASNLQGKPTGGKHSVDGAEVRQAARLHTADVARVLKEHATSNRSPKDIQSGEADDMFSMSSSNTGPHDLESGQFFDGSKLSEGAAPPPERQGDLMLDMSGYKIEGSTDDKAEQGSSISGMSGSTLVDQVGEDKLEEDILSFTKGLLQSVDADTLRDFFDPSDHSPDVERPNSPFADLIAPDPKSGNDSPRSSRAASPRPLSISSLQSLRAETESERPSSSDGVFHVSARQFSLRAGGKVHVFELSLCGGPNFGKDKNLDEKAFVEKQITFSQFMEQDDIAKHPDLVVKYDNRFLTWDTASPVLASLAVYRKSLIDHPEHHRKVDQSELEGKTRARSWSLWFSKRGATSSVSLPAQESSPPTSPGVSPPASPRTAPVGGASPVSTAVGTQEDQEDHRHYAKTLRLTSEQLKQLKLRKGTNTISFSVRSSYSGFATCTARVFLWDSDFQVVISDIDGTITKSDALGHVFTMIGKDWTHLGVAKLYTDIARNGYKMMYLTSRAIGQADTTREYLKGIKQSGFALPEGPVIMSPDRLMTSLHREVIMRKPEVFKMACLRDIKRLFGERTPFYAGFGNRITDALSYRSVDVPSSRIFTIDSNGEVKMELLELAGYKSSYIHMHDLVDQMFPPINRKTAPDFTDFNYWRQPIGNFELPDLSPPSPALSARSEGSSRLQSFRLGSIASSLSRRGSRSALSDTDRSRRGASPASPLLQASVTEEPDELDETASRSSRRGDSSKGIPMQGLNEEDEDTRSSSMPGSFNESDFEQYRRFSRSSQETARPTEAELYKKRVKGEPTEFALDGDGNPDEEDEEEDEEDDIDEEGEDGDEGDVGDDPLDFSSVPYL